MKLISLTKLSYLASLGIHLAIVALFLVIVYEPRPPIRSFQTSVFFENTSSNQLTKHPRNNQSSYKNPLQNIPLSRKHKRIPSIRKRKSILTAPLQQQKPSLRKYITPTKQKSLQEDNQAGYLRANRRTEKPVLPLLAKKPTLEEGLQPSIDDADLSGSPTGEEKGNSTSAEEPYIPPPSFSESQKRDHGKSQGKVASIWQKKSELTIYRKSLAQLVTANWIVPQTSVKSFQILIEAFIGPGGNLISIRPIKSSGLAVLDAAAERAIRVSTPFPEFPDSFDKNRKSYRAVFRFTPDQVAN